MSNFEIPVIVAALVLVLEASFLFMRYFRYRFLSFARHEHTPDMDSRSPEGYG
jgi:hypothetical protein